jgi:hypothetical protein
MRGLVSRSNAKKPKIVIPDGSARFAVSGTRVGLPLAGKSLPFGGVDMGRLKENSHATNL